MEKAECDVCDGVWDDGSGRERLGDRKTGVRKVLNDAAEEKEKDGED